MDVRKNTQATEEFHESPQIARQPKRQQLCLTLTKEAVSALGVAKGGDVYLTPDAHGGYLTAHDPDFERQMRIAERGMAKYRNALKALAKA